MKTTVKKYGFYSLIIAIALFFGALYFGEGLSFKAQEVIGYTTMVVCLIPIYFGIKHYRDYENNGAVNFKEGFIVGILIALCAGIGFAATDYIFVSYFNPEFFDTYLAYQIDGINASNLTAVEKTKEIAYAKEMMKDFGTPEMGALLMFATVLIFGIIISTLSTLTLQRKAN
jgi:uncharacterized membrane protein YfcA